MIYKPSLGRKPPETSCLQVIGDAASMSLRALSPVDTRPLRTSSASFRLSLTMMLLWAMRAPPEKPPLAINGCRALARNHRRDCPRRLSVAGRRHAKGGVSLGSDGEIPLRITGRVIGTQRRSGDLHHGLAGVKGDADRGKSSISAPPLPGSVGKAESAVLDLHAARDRHAEQLNETTRLARR